MFKEILEIVGIVYYLQSAATFSWSVHNGYPVNSSGRRCFAVAGPSTWNSLSDSLRD